MPFDYRVDPERAACCIRISGRRTAHQDRPSMARPFYLFHRHHLCVDLFHHL